MMDFRKIARTGAVALALIASWAAGTRPAHAQQPILLSASLTFHTLDDDKDNDTAVNVSLVNGNTEIASMATTGTRFPDQSDNGPFSVDVHGVHNQSELQHGTVKVHIAPNGHDTWRFRTDLRLTYSNGSVSTVTWGEIVLNQDGTDGTLTF